MALTSAASNLAGWLSAQGPLAYGLAFFAAACASAPVQVPLEIGAGALYGVRDGVALVTLAKNAGCYLAFAAARAALRARARAAKRAAALAAITTADAGDAPAATPPPSAATAAAALPGCFCVLAARFERSPLTAACLVRLSPLPIAVKNLGLAAVPSVSGTAFTISTFTCTLPYTVLYCALGAQSGSLADALAAVERRASGGSGSSGGSGGGAALAVSVAAGAAALLVRARVRAHACVHACVRAHAGALAREQRRRETGKHASVVRCGVAADTTR
jgi:uncharacterized membrane protein YdjX (TVP38/TMEM64 family)